MEVIRVVLKYLSPTAINTYLACPRKFYLRYVRKLKTKPSIYLVRGSIVHKVIEEFNLAAGPKATSLTDTQVIIRLLKLFQREWTAAEPRLAALNLPADELKAFHDESQIMLINYGYWFHGRRAPKPLATESRFYSKTLGLMGIVDAVYRFGEQDILVDYKTSKKAENQLGHGTSSGCLRPAFRRQTRPAAGSSLDPFCQIQPGAAGDQCR